MSHILHSFTERDSARAYIVPGETFLDSPEEKRPGRDEIQGKIRRAFRSFPGELYESALEHHVVGLSKDDFKQQQYRCVRNFRYEG